MKTVTSIFASLALLLTAVVSNADSNTLLKGAWSEQACHGIEGDVALSAQTRFKFENDQALVVHRYFETRDCSGEATYVVDYEGTLQIGENKTLPSGEVVTQYTITIETALPKVISSRQAVILASLNSCETHQWSFGDTKDVFSCVFKKDEMNIIKEMALVNGNTLYKGIFVTKA